MKNLLLPVVMVLTLAIGCLPATPVSNQPPVAYIDLVSPANAALGETVSFTGHGVDPDGTIAAYNWRSSLDGDLSTSASFKTSSLSQGTHTVWFKVQDDGGEWSKEILTTVIVIPQATGQPIVKSFNANPGKISPGGSSTLIWDVSGAATVSIAPDIGNVGLSGTRVILPAKTTTYTLTAINVVGTVTATAQVVIAEALPDKVELYSIAAEDGQVRRDAYVGQEPDVGDTKSGTAIQGFVSFDISMIPEGATVTSATLDLTAAAIYGEPFSKLGMLLVYDCQYQTLTASDFVVGPVLGAIYTIAVTPSQPITSYVLANAIQKRVDAGSSRFQLRFQFEKPYYYNNQADYVGLGEGRTKLTIEYQP
ncbi:MAG: PKD domain-containing protein [Dehalococcoidia bacterium]|nr:PKD domain-containing protein [Dehalococcoidia bacterium]